MNTNELIQKAAAGSEAALLELRQSFLPLLKKAAGQPHLKSLAADALEEAELSFLLAVKSYDSGLGIPFPGYAKAMVYGSLRTLFKQERRRWQREVYPTDPGEGQSFWDQLPDGRPGLDARLENADLRQALERLSPRQRQLLQLLYGQDCTQKKAAARLGITQQAAAALKNRSLRVLRQQLTADDL